MRVRQGIPPPQVLAWFLSLEMRLQLEMTGIRQLQNYLRNALLLQFTFIIGAELNMTEAELCLQIQAKLARLLKKAVWRGECSGSLWSVMGGRHWQKKLLFFSRKPSVGSKPMTSKTFCQKQANLQIEICGKSSIFLFHPRSSDSVHGSVLLRFILIPVLC